jgi:hypothetical protein
MTKERETKESHLEKEKRKRKTNLQGFCIICYLWISDHVHERGARHGEWFVVHKKTKKNDEGAPPLTSHLL